MTKHILNCMAAQMKKAPSIRLKQSSNDIKKCFLEMRAVKLFQNAHHRLEYAFKDVLAFMNESAFFEKGQTLKACFQHDRSNLLTCLTAQIKREPSIRFRTH